MFRSTIEPAFEIYRLQPLDEYHANILATAIDNQLEWTFEYYRGGDRTRLFGTNNLKAFRKELFKLCPKLRVMHDLADAAQHRILTRRADPPRLVLVASRAYVRSGRGLWVTGFNEPFLLAATAAVDFWRAWPD
jgi:hypothetical protein